MYSVFIVDDEQIVLEGIRKKIDWENSNFTFAGEATDGELALSMIQEVKPDILITDIKMPFMDGLELSRLLKKTQPWIRIIILSGHDEFDYAKKAISIGVEEYILKPFTHEDLLNSLNKVAAKLDAERSRFSDINKLKEELESSSHLLKNSFLTDLVSGAAETSAAMIKAQELGINLIAHFYKVLVSELDVNDKSQQTVQESKSRLLSLAESWEDAISFFMTPFKFVTVVIGNQEKDVEENSYNIAEAVLHFAGQKVIIRSAIGRTVEHLSNIKASYSDAEKLLEQSRFKGKSRIVSSDDIHKTSDGLLSLREEDPLVDRLKYAGNSELDAIIKQYLELLKNNTDHFSVIASYLLVDVIMAVSKLIEELGGNIKDVMPNILTHSFVDQAVQNEETFIVEIRKILTRLLEYRDTRMQGRYGDVIIKAKDYIEHNYSSQDTCLRLVADQVHLSPNHFSTIFSQECGITFIEYLTNVRIEAAKKLLKETDMKGADIAYECGFSDPHYFSFIFKKNTGLSPREFKAGK